MKNIEIEKLIPLIGKRVIVSARRIQNNYLIQGELIEIDRSNHHAYSLIIRVKPEGKMERGCYYSGKEYVSASHINSVKLATCNT